MNTKYAVAITAVTDRADLFVECTESLLANLDQAPDHLLIHEDTRRETPAEMVGAIGRWLIRVDPKLVVMNGEYSKHTVSKPNVGMGLGMLWAFEKAQALGYEFVLYTQEDWRAVRPIPVKKCLELMTEFNLHHVRFNKRKTMRAKHEDTPHPWYKIEMPFGDPPTTLCVSDHWYTQTSLWRVSEALPGLRQAASAPGAGSQERFISMFNHYQNVTRHGLTTETWNNQALRHERLRTFIFGPIGEPRFIEHAGSTRGTGRIKDHSGA